MALPGPGILVLGMHRSATSLVTGILSSLGCTVGDRLVPADEHNPHGYWEHREVVEAHDELLHSLGRSWSDPRPIPASRLEGEAAAAARARLEEILRRDLLPHAAWVLKDPRLCRLMPLWLRLLDDVRAPITFLHVLRSPAAVARSLAARDAMPTVKCDALWLRHNLDAEQATRGRVRCWIVLEKFLDDPLATLKQLTAALPLPATPSTSLLDEVVEEHFDGSLLHHRPPATAGGDRHHPWTLEAYERLTGLAGADERSGHDGLDRLRERVERAEALVYDDEWGWEDGVRQERDLRLRREVESQTRQVEVLRDEQEVLRGRAASIQITLEKLAQAVARLEPGLDDPGLLQLVGELQGALGALPRRLEELSQRLERLDRAVREDLALVAPELSRSAHGLERLERAVREELIGHHAALLERSLAVSAALESEWSRFREKVLEAEAARDAADRERQRALAERDEALACSARERGEREAAERERDVALAACKDAEGELSRSLRDLDAARTKAARATVERDRSAAERERANQDLAAVTGSRSWRLTRPFRAAGRALRHALRWMEG